MGIVRPTGSPPQADQSEQNEMGGERGVKDREAQISISSLKARGTFYPWNPRMNYKVEIKHNLATEYVT